MTPRTLAARSLRYFWRAHVAAALGVGVAVAALAGALLVGDSVRTSLRELAVSRLGRTDALATAPVLFTEQLAGRVAGSPEFHASWTGAVPLLALDGVVIHPSSGRRAGGVQIFGVDDRFWQFQGVPGVTGPAGRDAFVSPALARELGATPGETLLLRVQKPSALPAGVIQGRRDAPGRGVRLSLSRVLTRNELGEFSPRPQQGDARIAFVSLDRLQRDIDQPRRANMMLFGAASTPAPLLPLIEDHIDLADLGVHVRPIAGPTVAIESDSGYVSDEVVTAATAAARDLGADAVPVLTYLATVIRANGHEIPYSLVSALPEAVIERQVAQTPSRVPARPRADAAVGARDTAPLWLSEWAADDLGARVGDAVTLDYYVWSDADGLTTSSASFVLTGVLPMRGLSVDRDLTPDYPGISTTPNIASWDPPFPVDLSRVRKKDEEFWNNYRTAPKAFIRIADGQALWRSAYGRVTSLRVSANGPTLPDLQVQLGPVLRRRMPASVGEFHVIPVRAEALAAAAGTTDFGEYFTYFSVFVVVASLLLAVLFFRLGLEQRAAEVGTLGALGYAPRTTAGIFLIEGGAVAIIGTCLGAIGAVGYSALMMRGLRTWWVGAVGTTELTLHVSPTAIAAGAVGGILAALLCIAWSLKVLWQSSTHQLMSGAWVDSERRLTGSSTRLRAFAVASLVGAVLFVALAAIGMVPSVAGFFGSGILLLVAGLAALTIWLRGTTTNAFADGLWPLARLGMRNARYRPSRSVLSTGLIASATFVIVSVGAFRETGGDLATRNSGSGGYPLIGESLVPLMHDLGTHAGREALGLGSDLPGLEVARFRLRPGDDASCLNLYRPRSPRLLGAPQAFIDSGRFSFSGSMATTEAEKRNPWLLLNKRFADGALPAIGDATSLSYAFHLGVGNDFVMDGPGGHPVRLRIVGALRDSVLQSELILHETQFVRLFPRNDGYRVFLIAAPPDRLEAVTATLEDRLQDFGLDVQSTAVRLASYHRVENTYLSTFQALGALGLVLGTCGLGTVLLRNVLERRRELAVLRATGYRPMDLMTTVIAESALLIASGLALGVLSAAVAIAPAFAERGQPVPVAQTLILLSAVAASGVVSTVFATRAITSAELLPALRNE
jgi:ABC-type lipoprotein release transport system permease subunit